MGDDDAGLRRSRLRPPSPSEVGPAAGRIEGHKASGGAAGGLPLPALQEPGPASSANRRGRAAVYGTRGPSATPGLAGPTREAWAVKSVLRGPPLDERREGADP